jgi:hypothetical protein
VLKPRKRLTKHFSSHLRVPLKRRGNKSYI